MYICFQLNAKMRTIFPQTKLLPLIKVLIRLHEKNLLQFLIVENPQTFVVTTTANSKRNLVGGISDGLDCFQEASLSCESSKDYKPSTIIYF